MPAWPTGILAKSNTEFEVPGPQLSIGQSGKVTRRSTAQVGRSWEEVYFGDVRDNDFRKLMAITRDYLRNGTSFTISHRDHLTPKGTYGGTPLVDGANQTGSTITLKGATADVSNWARAGDLVTFAGITLVYEVPTDTNSVGGGAVTLPISPPIFSGGSPADEAAVTTTGISVTAIVIGADFPRTNANNFGLLTVQFLEAP